MRRWWIACSAVMLTLGLAATAHADEWNKLTYLTFSGPVQLPGITLPAGTYRFQLADPESGRRVIRVSDKDGSKSYGIFLSVSDQKLQPSGDPVVLFKESPAGSPQAVLAWFYPGETFGYEFAYPHDQALKIAKANHKSVLTVNETARSSSDNEQIASMKNADVARVDENDKKVSTDEALKDSSARRPSTTASNAAPSTTTAPGTTAARTSTAANRALGTSGQTAAPTTAQSNTAPRRHLPRTAGELPLIELLSGLAFAGGFGVRAFRRR
jgi:hypothetical protein